MKKYRIRYRKNLVSEKSFGFGFVQIFGFVTHCLRHTSCTELTHLLKLSHTSYIAKAQVYALRHEPINAIDFQFASLSILPHMNEKKFRSSSRPQLLGPPFLWGSTYSTVTSSTISTQPVLNLPWNTIMIIITDIAMIIIETDIIIVLIITMLRVAWGLDGYMWATQPDSDRRNSAATLTLLGMMMMMMMMVMMMMTLLGMIIIIIIVTLLGMMIMTIMIDLVVDLFSWSKVDGRLSTMTTFFWANSWVGKSLNSTVEIFTSHILQQLGPI